MKATIVIIAPVGDAESVAVAVAQQLGVALDLRPDGLRVTEIDLHLTASVDDDPARWRRSFSDQLRQQAGL